MKQLTCEMCNSTDLLKQDGVFVCQSCGTKYSVEEAKRMMSDGTSEMIGTVKVDGSEKLNNLYQIARRAKDDENSESAAKYYDLILQEDPMSWEASFYSVYYSAMQTNIANIQSAANKVSNCASTVLKLIKDTVTNADERKAAVLDVVSRVITISSMLYNAAKNHYDGISLQIKNRYNQEHVNRAFACINALYLVGDQIETIFDEETLHQFAVSPWKTGIIYHNSIVPLLANKVLAGEALVARAQRIQKYEPSYQLPPASPIKSGGCYVATAVYGSYDCPQVWTLRRFRDNTLAQTWYGRAFIRTYYAISPTLVRWFGSTAWFSRMWRGRLDTMVARLQARGVDDTEYVDR